MSFKDCLSKYNTIEQIQKLQNNKIIKIKNSLVSQSKPGIKMNNNYNDDFIEVDEEQSKQVTNLYLTKGESFKRTNTGRSAKNFNESHLIKTNELKSSNFKDFFKNFDSDEDDSDESQEETNIGSSDCTENSDYTNKTDTVFNHGCNMELSGLVNNNSNTWNVSTYLEYTSNSPLVKACGILIPDIDETSDHLKSGSFGAIVDVIDEKNNSFVLRVSPKEKSFSKHVDIYTVINTIVHNRTSPCFKKLKTAFSFNCAEAFEKIPKEWVKILNNIRLKWKEKDNMHCLVIERARLGNMDYFIKNWQKYFPKVEDETLSNQKKLIEKEIMFTLLQGMATMHHYGITHKDIKMKNIVVDWKSDESIKNDYFLFLENSGAEHHYKTSRLNIVDQSLIDQQIQSLESVNGKTNGLDDTRKQAKKFIFSYIDFDFSVLSCGNQIRNLNNCSEGTPCNMSPEMIFLSCAAIATDVRYNRCDVYSLGVVFVEILTKKSFKELIIEYGLKNVTSKNIDIATMAFSGIPKIKTLKKYVNYIKHFIQRVDKIKETEQNRFQCAKTMKYLQCLCEMIKQIEGFVVASTLDDTKNIIEDSMRQDYGISSELFYEGIAFHSLKRHGITDKRTLNLIKSMLDWDFTQRLDSCLLLLHDNFDELKTNKIVNYNSDSDKWILQLIPTDVKNNAHIEVNINENHSIPKSANAVLAQNKTRHELDFDALLSKKSSFEKMKQTSLENNNYCIRWGCSQKRVSLTGLKIIKGKYCSQSCETVYKRLTGSIGE